jgi:hypothetical protein
MPTPSPASPLRFALGLHVGGVSHFDTMAGGGGTVVNASRAGDG